MDFLFFLAVGAAFVWYFYRTVSLTSEVRDFEEEQDKKSSDKDQ